MRDGGLFTDPTGLMGGGWCRTLPDDMDNLVQHVEFQWINLGSSTRMMSLSLIGTDSGPAILSVTLRLCGAYSP